MTDYAKARTNMVESQLRPNKVSDPVVLKAFLDTRRELFIPDSLQGAAYSDDDLPIGDRRYLMEPLVLARLIQEAAIRPTDRVLDVGCGAGYCVAILAQLAGSVVAIEADPVLAARSRDLLAALENVAVVECALEQGCGDRGPYDAILLGGAVPAVPPALLDQLAEGGRLVAVVKNTPDGMGEAVIVERVRNGFSRRSLFNAGIHVLPGFAAASSFTF